MSIPVCQKQAALIFSVRRSRHRLNAQKSSKSATEDDESEREECEDLCELHVSTNTLWMITQERQC